MDRNEAHAKLDQWIDDGAVGVFFLHRSPSGSLRAWTEQVHKLRELSPAVAEGVEAIMEITGGLNLELVSRKDGKPDRIKVTKAL